MAGQRLSWEKKLPRRQQRWDWDNEGAIGHITWSVVTGHVLTLYSLPIQPLPMLGLEGLSATECRSCCILRWGGTEVKVRAKNWQSGANLILRPRHATERNPTPRLEDRQTGAIVSVCRLSSDCEAPSGALHSRVCVSVWGVLQLGGETLLALAGVIRWRNNGRTREWKRASPRTLRVERLDGEYQCMILKEQ